MTDHDSPWDDAPFVVLGDREIAEIVRRHDLGVDAWERLQSTGVIHTIYALGSSLVLRVPKRIDEATSDLRTEVVAAPVAAAAGVRTPALVIFDESLDIVDVPFTVFERVDGEPLGLEPFSPDAYRELGRDLARLHTGVTKCDDPNGWLDVDDRFEPRDLLETLVASGRLDPDSAVWLRATFDSLRPAVTGAASFRRFIHNDVQPNNVLARDGTYRALIDWGDAAWGDPARELRSIPPRAVPFVLAGYREITLMDGDDEAEARVLWDQLGAAVYSLGRQPLARPGEWSRPTGARLVALLAEVSSESSWARPLLSRP